MKFTSAFSLLAFAIKVGTTQASCGKCLPLPPASKSFQTIRYYNITDPNWSAEQAMEEAAKTTALGLAKMPGFQRYTAAAVTGDSQLVLFMNQFASEEEAEAASVASSNGTWPNANTGKMERFLSAVTEGYASFPEGKCFTESQVGKLLTTVLYKYQDPASVDIAEEFKREQEYYNVMYKNAPGFVMNYVSANSPEGSDKSAWKIMESAADQAAYEELKAEANYQWTGPPSDLVISTAGTIGLDVLCSSHHLTDATDVPVPPPAPATTATAKASKASSAKSSKTADAKAEKTSSAKAAKPTESAKATKEPKAKKTSPPKTAKATKAFSTSSKATKAPPTPSAKATKAADAKADKASSAKASKAKSSTKGGKAGSISQV